ncbi:hypothetical protein ABVF61_22590 [Roseibium sp. HPY-6]|uniref:hypothetical protein n=1 Tax=Roseibium sp. HPY-6 TaxID=3229852 RepID=UPI00338E4601
MLHTGNIYETRARAARNRELRALAKAVAGLFFAAAPSRNVHRKKPANDAGFAADTAAKHDRAA